MSAFHLYRYLWCAMLGLGALGFGPTLPTAQTQDTPPILRPENVLLITADDLNWDSLGSYGCSLEGVTPHLDALAAEGLRFEHAYTNIASCMPSRATWMTGLYPHRNGALGFGEIQDNIPSLVEELGEAGFYTGILGKASQTVPSRKRAWDEIVPSADLGNGRLPTAFRQAAEAFFKAATAKERSFFLMVNISDPHRPFAGSQQEQWRRLGNGNLDRSTFFPQSEITFNPDDVPVPGFLPDVPDIRLEIAEYFASVHRADRTAGAILEALDGAGFRGNTLVMFLSDHGMSLPFAKTNCYLNSTRVPWLVRWPAVVTPDSVDADHFIAGIDLAPTLLDILDLPPLPDSDGASFLPLLLREEQPERYFVWSQFNETSGGRAYPMRGITTANYGYIYNDWSDEVTIFRNEAQSGRSMNAMKDAAESDPTVARRVRHFLYRTPEELYDYANDPDAVTNLVNDPLHAETLVRFRNQLQALMTESDDPLLEAYNSYLRNIQ